METSVKIIKFTTIMSGIFMILTYGVSLNIAHLWFDIEWLSNNFLLTIFGGIFASMLVVLICEVHKYLLLKREAENQIFYYAGTIFGNLKTIQKDLEKQQKENIEANDYFTKYINETHEVINILQNLNYVSFCKKNKMWYVYKNMCLWLTTEVFYMLDDGFCYKIAINRDKINNLKTFGVEGQITSKSPYVSKILEIYYPRLLKLIEEMDKYMYMIDKQCNGRYVWDLKKASILKSFEDLSEDVFEKYLAQKDNT